MWQVLELQLRPRLLALLGCYSFAYFCDTSACHCILFLIYFEVFYIFWCHFWIVSHFFVGILNSQLSFECSIHPDRHDDSIILFPHLLLYCEKSHCWISTCCKLFLIFNPSVMSLPCVHSVLWLISTSMNSPAQPSCPFFLGDIYKSFIAAI